MNRYLGVRRYGGTDVVGGLLLAMVAAVPATVPLPALAAPKTDVIVMANGDHITGEIKSLEHNRLKLSTNHMGTIYIEWDKVARAQTNQYLLLERSDGVRYYGQLTESGQDATLKVRRRADEPEDELAMSAVVRAQPIEGGDFIDRLDGYISAGIDVQKASDRRSLDFAAGLSARTQIRAWAIDASANLTDDSAGETSERYDAQGTWRRLLAHRNFYYGFGQLSRNTELELNLRSLVGGGLGRYIVQTNLAEWLVGAGLAYTHENYFGGERFDSLELPLITSFSIFRYDFPETDVGGSLTLLPSLTQSGRYRAEADLRAKYEFIDDLYFELKFYGSYDSKPPTEDATSSDYGVVTSLGYSF